MPPIDGTMVTRARPSRPRVLLVAVLAFALALLAVDRYAAAVHKPNAASTRVAIYTTAWCGYCQALREKLDREGVSYTEYDVEKSLQGYLGFWALRGRGVPVSAIGPEVVYGYRIPEIERALSALEAKQPSGIRR